MCQADSLLALSRLHYYNVTFSCVKMTGTLPQQTVVIAFFYTHTLKNMHEVEEELLTYSLNERYYGKIARSRNNIPSIGKFVQYVPQRLFYTTSSYVN